MTLEALQEQLVFFSSGGVVLAGILTIPAEPNGQTVLIPWGAGAYPSSGRNRLRTRLARNLAEQGYHAFRFDYQGVGESDGDYRRPDMAAPNTEEVVAACSWLISQGLPRIVIVANCFGGWSALMSAHMIPSLEGMALINMPVRRDHQQVRAGVSPWRWWAGKLRKVTLSKLRSPARRARFRRLLAAKASAIVGLRSGATGFSDAIRYLLERRIPVLLIYGDDDFFADLKAELDQGLRAAIEAAGPPTRLVTVAERLEGYASLGAQDVLLKEVLPWLHELSESSA
ncbi:MAG: alpha/beta fold hydrolase [Acidimicrobiia bacterium]